jgi:hypothetical protein
MVGDAVRVCVSRESRYGDLAVTEPSGPQDFCFLSILWSARRDPRDLNADSTPNQSHGSKHIWQLSGTEVGSQAARRIWVRPACDVYRRRIAGTGPSWLAKRREILGSNIQHRGLHGGTGFTKPSERSIVSVPLR